MADAKKVRVTGVGFNTDIEIGEGQTLTAALKAAGINCAADGGGLTIKVGGSEYTEGASAEPTGGERVTVTPAKASHG